jgi:hypothetical protein
MRHGSLVEHPKHTLRWVHCCHKSAQLLRSQHSVTQRTLHLRAWDKEDVQRRTARMWTVCAPKLRFCHELAVVDAL